MTDFAGKVVLVTGAARGIGRAIALAFAAAGARVAVNDLNPTGAEQTVRLIEEAGGQPAPAPPPARPAQPGRAVGPGGKAWVADVANKLAIQTMVQEILETWGRIDILINNAGVEPHQPILTLGEWDWDRTLAVNLKGPFLLTQYVGRAMKETGGGVVINIASIAGRAAGLRDRSAYVASKTGLVGFTKEAARELAPYNIRVNAVCPGVIITEMTAHLRRDQAMMDRWLADIPQGRLGEPDDVTGLVLFLCCDAARYITGQAINVDGGKVMI